MKARLLALTILAAGCAPAHPAPPREVYNSLLNVRALAFNSNLLYGGRSLGSGEKNADLLTWDAGIQKEVHAHQNSIVGLSFLNNQLVSASADGTLKLWTPDFKNQSMGSSHWYAAMGNAASGKVAILHAAGSSTFQPRNAEIEIWDLERRVKTRTFPTPDALNLSTSQKNDLIATLYAQPVVRLWHADGTSAGEIPTEASAICLSPDGKTLASGGPDGALHIWDTGSLKLRHDQPSIGQRVTVLSFSPDGSQLAAGCEGKLALYGQEKLIWQKSVDSYASPTVLAFSPDGRKLASAGPSKVLLWPEI